MNLVSNRAKHEPGTGMKLKTFAAFSAVKTITPLLSHILLKRHSAYFPSLQDTGFLIQWISPPNTPP